MGARRVLRYILRETNKHEIEQAAAEGISIEGGWAPVGLVKGADGRATALRVAQCEAKFVGGQLKIDMKPGTERDIPADLIVSAIGQSVDFTGLEEFNNGKGAVSADRNYRVAGKEGIFAGGDVLRPHLLTTAIGHGSIAADGIDRRFLRGEEPEKRPKIDVHQFDLVRKMLEKGLHGLYHVVGPQAMSKYQFVVEIARRFGFRDSEIAPKSINTSSLIAKRANNLCLSIDKFCTDLDDVPPEFSTGLNEFYTQFQQGYPQKIRSYAQ